MSYDSVGYGCVMLSLLVHVGAVWGSQQARPAAPAPFVTELELAPVIPARPTPAPAPTPPAEPPKPEPISEPRPGLRTPVARPTPPAEAPAPPPPELTGRTLVGNEPAGFAAPEGNGAVRTEPIQSSGGPASTPPVLRVASAPSPPAAAAAPLTQPFSELSRKPAPPPLAGALRQNYPATARNQGQRGEAKVRALIDARGHVSSVSISFESAQGFGAACRKTLLESRWTPPLGKRGEPTATFVSYRCKFEVAE